MPIEIDNLWKKGIDILKKSGAKVIDISLRTLNMPYQHTI